LIDSFSTAGAFAQKHSGGLGIIVWEVPLIKHFFREAAAPGGIVGGQKIARVKAVIAADFRLVKPPIP